GSLMKFTDLAACGAAHPIYTIAWRIHDDGNEVWSRRFLKFKDGVDIVRVARLLAYALTQIVKDLDLGSDVAVTVALSSRATELIATAPLAKAGEAACMAARLKWMPKLFKKQAHRSLHGLPTGAERDSEVQGKYTCVSNVPGSSIIIIDDLVTRGATFGEMA